MNILKHDFDSSSELLQAGLLLNQLEDLIGFISANEFRKTSINQFIEVEASELMVINLWHPMCPDITEVHFFRDMDSNWWPYKIYELMSDITTQTQFIPRVNQ
ncbi:hypothetical protein NTB97_003062 [Salmonella enterica]|jgi:hypothetical protein|uniref:hypothetical protein n=1 Tax=Enterobacteriaceae TaxID=543 RepID=UPI00259C99E2|nr:MULTISPECIES: hypothetical protein [Enterobacteriaceae]EBD9299200.1 hypothetical protein [Salmonella enterica]EEB5060174.1 hypothetical protein [Salmonella enterica]EKK4450478.1 hypothetical protein [Salmonella enterica]MDM4819846.1 hypothetical protein [Escherichia coli]MDM4847520.1 hypothetical protein [Escherichia coli]